MERDIHQCDCLEVIMKNLFMIIVMTGAGLLPKQAQSCYGTGYQPIEEITKQNEEKLSHPQKRRKRVWSKPIRSIQLRRRSSQIHGKTGNTVKPRKSVSIYSCREE